MTSLVQILVWGTAAMMVRSPGPVPCGTGPAPLAMQRKLAVGNQASDCWDCPDGRRTCDMSNICVFIISMPANRGHGGGGGNKIPVVLNEQEQK
jgi:hypothetical protein